jgi:hypothetical protein
MYTILNNNFLTKKNNNMKEITTNKLSPEILEKVVLNGDLSVLDPKQKMDYYSLFCQRIGLDPITKPFQILKLDGKEIMYADRGCAAQLNKIHKISHQIVSSEVQVIDGNNYYRVTSRASNEDKQFLESISVVPLFKEGGEWKQSATGKKYFQKNGQIINYIGDELANAMMKAETKAKRRATLDIVGLGILDESEASTISDAPFEVVPNRENEPPPPPMTDNDKLYRTATGDIELICTLIADATDYHLLKTFQAVNDKFFKSNGEMNDRLKEKYTQLKKQAIEKAA